MDGILEQILEQILETWRTNHRINLFLIDRIDEEGMKCTLSKRGGRNVVRQFTHLHNVRAWHLEARARDLAKGLHVYTSDEEPGRDELKAALTASAERVEDFLRRATTGEGKARPSRKGVVATLGYFIAHESHHRGSILLTLKTCGHRVDQKASYAIWDWDKM